MATEQGICKNCGSLLVVDSSDELCECLFCDCVFPSAEAIEIFNNPDGVEFPNLPQPKRDTKVAQRHVVTPVFEDVVEKAVKVDKAVNKEAKVEKLFEISPDDIKAPQKVKRNVLIITAASILLILGISIPLSVLRHNHCANISDNISVCFEKADLSVDTADEDGYSTGYKIWGQGNNKLALVSSKEVEKEQVVEAFNAFCEIRGDEYGYAADEARYYKGVVLTVYAPNGKFTLKGSKDGANVDSVELEEPEPEASESAAEESTTEGTSTAQ